jgi:rhodanese-related sulfurtransferase
MLDGYPGWKKSGRPLITNTKFVKSGNIVLIDLRKSDDFKSGHIPRAYNMAFEDYAEDLEDELEIKKRAPIVLYGPGADKVAKFVKGLGFQKVSIYQNGLTEWQNAGNTLSTDPSPEEITWKRKMGKGEVTPADFMKVANGEDKTKIILDVRNTGETTDGVFNNSINIPLADVETKAKAMLPADKMILVHCATGTRAEMAVATLKQLGYKAKYLVADLECEAGACEIAD